MKAWLAFLPALALAGAASADNAPGGSLLILHYCWKHDTLTLVDSKRVPAAVKTPRSAKRPTTAPKPGWIDPGPESPFGYELVDAAGNPFAERFMDDPGVKYVEYQGPGDKTLKRTEVKMDSADIYVRVAEANAKSIRFYRHRSAFGPGSVAPLAKPGAAQGPVAPPSRTLLAEFPLE